MTSEGNQKDNGIEETLQKLRNTMSEKMDLYGNINIKDAYYYYSLLLLLLVGGALYAT